MKKKNNNIKKFKSHEMINRNYKLIGTHTKSKHIGECIRFLGIG